MKKILCIVLMLMLVFACTACEIFSGNDLYADQMAVVSVDTGNSDCTVIRFPNSQCIVIDTADSDDVNTIISHIEDMGISKIDALILTHAHADHIGSAKKLLERFEVEKIYMSPKTHTSKTYENLLLTIKNQGKKATAVRAGMSFQLGGAEIEFLSPQDKEYEDINDSSVVAKITYGSKVFLFTGDITQNVEQELVEAYPDGLKADYLKVAHHGSRYSSSDEFLDLCAPKYAVILCGRGNSYGHPHQPALDRLQKHGAMVYRTDKDSDIVAQCDGKNINITTKSE